MINKGDTEAYLNTELDKFQTAIDHRDKDGAWSVLEHVRAEAGDQVAGVFVRMLADRGLSSLLPPPDRPPTPPAKRSVEIPGPGSNKGLVIVLLIIIVVLTVAVVVLVTIQVTRPSTATTTTQPQVTTSVVAPAMPPAGTASTTTTVAPPPAAPGYKLEIQNQPLTLGGPTSVAGCITVADLDIPAVKVGGFLNGSTDLVYGACIPSGLFGGSARFFGNGPLEQPVSAEQCAASARTDTVSANVEVKDLAPGKSAFCVVTHGGNVAWLRLMDEVGHAPYYPDLKFQFTLWKRVP